MKSLKNNKLKKGFTLIEMVAVVAIIGVLAAILVPKIAGYIKEAKKTEVIDQARKVVQAYEGAVMKGRIIDGTTVTSGMRVTSVTDATMLSLLDASTSNIRTKFDKLGSATIADCFDVAEGGEFTVSLEGILDTANIEDKSSR